MWEYSDHIKFHVLEYLNSLSVNRTKWLNALKQFVGKSRRIVLLCLTILWGWHLKGYLVYRYALGTIYDMSVMS